MDRVTLERKIEEVNEQIAEFEDSIGELFEELEKLEGKLEEGGM